MSYAQKTLNAAATTGYVIDLGQSCGKVTVQTVGRAAFKFAYSSAPATPTSAYLPGSGATTDTIELALYLKRQNLRPRQIQDFIPTPMSMAATMYYTGIDPLTMTPVYTARDLREKRMMTALLFWWDPQHWPLARDALSKAGRRDLIGRAPHCLIPPEYGVQHGFGMARPAGASPRSGAPLAGGNRWGAARPSKGRGK